jgi:hypothetical protein
MHTSILLVALAGFPGFADVGEAPTWHTDYSEARKLGQSENKPLAIFVGAGKDGWTALATDGKLNSKVDKTLLSSYICVYVDASTASGKRLATALGIESGKGIVISDAPGKLMAFHHDGTLANEDLGRYLARYADPTRSVEWTESKAPVVRQSFYPPANQFAPANFGNFGGGGGGGC